MKLTKHEKTDLTLIIISAISLIASFILSLDYIAWIAVLFNGIPILKECIEGLKEFDIKADLLVSIAIIASIIIGEVFAAGEIATIMAIGGFLEEYTVKKTRTKIEKLAKMAPEKATRIKNGVEEKIPVENIIVGDILKVVPGTRIPTDGIIISGETSIDQSTLTGESLPVDKKINNEVYSGTMNLYGSFTMKTTKISSDSSLQRLIDLVESSKPENSKIVRQTDKWATLIVIIAFTAALLTYLFTFDIIRSVTILVVFCPCALVLATPTAIIASIGNLTRYGILIKDGESLEELAHVSEFVFDKTGTLTKGTPEVVNIISDNPKEMMYFLTSLESKSEHPLAQAIVKSYDCDDLGDVNDFKMHTGKGVSGEIDGHEIMAGNERLIKSKNITLKNEYSSNNGEIVIYVAKDSVVIGEVHLADTLRENAKETVSNLKRLRIKTTMLTGDNEKTARFIAGKTRIRSVKSNCLPEDKVSYIKREQCLGHRVAMIGDGVNDAPSLKKADVGIAMGSIGSDISVDAANIALVNEDISNINHLIGIARKTVKTINISIAFALTVNVVAMGLAILGVLNPVEGALIHNIGSVIVILYSSTLAGYRPSPKNHKNLGIAKSLNKQIT